MLARTSNPAAAPSQVLDNSVVNTTLYAMGTFCLLFYTRLFAPGTYHILVGAITTAPHMVGPCIPTSLLETHGFNYLQIIGVAWEHMRQLHSGMSFSMSPYELVALMNSLISNEDTDSDTETETETEAVDMLSLLVTAAANNAV